MKRLISFICISAVLAAGLVQSVAAVETGSTLKPVPVYRKSMDEKETLGCLFFDDMPNVPYLSMELYYQTFMEGKMTVVRDGNGNYVYTEEQYGQTAIANADTDVIVIDDPSYFLATPVFKKEDSELLFGGPDEMVRVSATDIEVKPSALTIDLSQYGIDIREKNGALYYPFATLCDLFNNADCLTAAYSDGKIFFVSMYDEVNGGNAKSDDLGNLGWITEGDRPADMTELAYKELCFQIDNLYGKPGQARSKELVKRIESEGFDKALEEGGIVDDINLTDMKKYLKSTNIGEYGAGMLMLHALLVDGGHSKWGTPFLLQIVNDPELDQTEFAKEYKKLSEKDPTVAGLIDVIKPLETELTFLQDDLIAFRDESFGKAEKSWLGDDGETECAWLYIFDNTAVFRFDHFDKQVIKSESGAHPFNEALAFAKEKGCENFVIDLSANTGGNDDVMGFILSSIENTNANSYHIDGKTRYQMKDTFYADKNLDGMIDEKDEDVTYDFNYAMMISRVSFSNGNSLPALASEAGIPMLGERSGGGGCSMSFFGLPGESNKYGISGTLMITYSDYESVDPGVPADYEMLEIKEDGTIGNAPLYDPKELVATVNQHFENKK